MRTIALADLCDIKVGRTPARAEPSFWGAGHRWLSIADMNQGLAISRTREQITDAGAKAGRLVEPGTVLLSFKLSIGKVGIAEVPLFTNEAIAALPVKDESTLDPRYLMRALQSMDLAGESNRAAMGATLNKRSLAQVPIPIPPLDEQRRIAAILDHADALRAKRRQALAHLDLLTQSIFYDMFGATLERTTLGEVFEVSTGSTPSRKDPGNYGGSTPWVKTGEVHGVITETEEHVTSTGISAARLRLFPPGSVLIAMYGQGRTRGSSAVLGIDATTNQACAVLPPSEKMLPSFVAAQLRIGYERLRASARGGNQANLNLSLVRQFEVVQAPLSQQQEFAARIASVEQQRSAQQRALAADDELFASLQFRAFRGEL